MTALIEGKYEVIAKLKEGGMGAIYKVRHVLLDEIRVVKVMRPALEEDPDAQRRFQQEAKLATSLKHPNIAALIDFAEDKDHTFYMVMEFIDGVNLSEFLTKSGPPPIPTTLDIGMQTLSALGYLHKRGIVHRDISPENIMLTRDAEDKVVVKLIDLGVAKQTGTQSMTVTGMFVGKLKYGSPEQLGVLKPGETIDGRSDIYSMGCVLYQALTGLPAFEADTMQSYVMHHLMQPPRPFEGTDPEGRIPLEVRAAVLKSLAKKREERWDTAEEFGEALWLARERLMLSPENTDATRALNQLDRAQALQTPSPEKPSGISEAQALLAHAFAQKTPPPGGTSRTKVSGPIRPAWPTGTNAEQPPKLDLAESPTTIQSNPVRMETTSAPRLPIERDHESFVAPVPSRGKGKALPAGVVVVLLLAALLIYFKTRTGSSSSSAVAVPEGSLLLTAEPWGHVTEVFDLANKKRVEGIPPTLTTPTRIELRPGRYKITLRCDPLDKETAQEVEVVSGQTALLHAVVPGFDLERIVGAYAP